MASRRAQDRPLAEELPPPERVNHATLNLDPNNPRIQRVGDDLDQTAISNHPLAGIFRRRSCNVHCPQRIL